MNSCIRTVTMVMLKIRKEINLYKGTDAEFRLLTSHDIRGMLFLKQPFATVFYSMKYCRTL